MFFRIWKYVFLYFLYLISVSSRAVRDKRDASLRARQKIQVLSGPDMNTTAFPDPKNCKRFFICRGGVYHLQCPIGLVYNTDLSKCDLNVKGSNRPGVRINPESDKDLSVFPDLFDVTKLFLCDGYSQHYECSGELFYNADYAKCDLLGSLACRLRFNP